jgi:hypothetical protein
LLDWILRRLKDLTRMIPFFNKNKTIKIEFENIQKKNKEVILKCNARLKMQAKLCL